MLCKVILTYNAIKAFNEFIQPTRKLANSICIPGWIENLLNRYISLSIDTYATQYIMYGRECCRWADMSETYVAIQEDIREVVYDPDDEMSISSLVDLVNSIYSANLSVDDEWLDGWADELDEILCSEGVDLDAITDSVTELVTSISPEFGDFYDISVLLVGDLDGIPKGWPSFSCTIGGIKPAVVIDDTEDDEEDYIFNY